MVVEHIKKVKGKQKVYCVYIPASYMAHMGWKAEQVVSLHPSENGLEIVALKNQESRQNLQ